MKTKALVKTLSVSPDIWGKKGSGLVRGLKSVERLNKVILGHENSYNPLKTSGAGGFWVFGHFWVLKGAQVWPK